LAWCDRANAGARYHYHLIAVVDPHPLPTVAALRVRKVSRVCYYSRSIFFSIEVCAFDDLHDACRFRQMKKSSQFSD